MMTIEQIQAFFCRKKRFVYTITELVVIPSLRYIFDRSFLEKCSFVGDITLSLS